MMTGPQASTPANQLAEYLHRGGSLIPIAPSFAVMPDEYVYAQVPVRIDLFGPGGDGVWVKKTGIPLSPLGMVVRAGQAAGNSHRKAKARREMQETWRPIDSGTLFITSKRLVMQLSRSWDIIDYQMVMNINADRESVILEMNGRETTRVVMAGADYHFVMIYYCKFQQASYPPATS